MEKVYRIVPFQEWNNIQGRGYIVPSKVDIEYMHLSLKEYVEETANRYFLPSEQLIVLEIDAERLADGLLFEPVKSRNNAIFPHYYGERIPLSFVIRSISLRFLPEVGFQFE